MAARGLINRVCGEYYEMPGLRLTLAQASRLWHVDRAACEGVLTELMRTGFLTQMRDGSFVSAGALRRPVRQEIGAAAVGPV